MEPRKVKLGKKGQVVIPKEIREALGWRAGAPLLVSLEGRRVVLVAPPEDYARRTRGALRGLWGTPDDIRSFLAEERGAWEKRWPAS